MSKRIAVLAAMAAALMTATSGWIPAGAGVERPAHAPARRRSRRSPSRPAWRTRRGSRSCRTAGSSTASGNTGRVMLLNPKNGNQSVMYTITNVRSGGEQGLLGLAVDPGWPNKRFVYAYATRQVKPLQNQILKIKVDRGRGHLTQGHLAARHGGRHVPRRRPHRLRPGREALRGRRRGPRPENAQDLTNDAGKVLRMNRNGSVPEDNPFDDSRIFSYGLRNSFGFAFDPQSGTLWETENGPQLHGRDQRREGRRKPRVGSERDLLGQPRRRTRTRTVRSRGSCRWSGSRRRSRRQAWRSARAAGSQSSEGALFFGASNTGEIREIELTADREGVASMSVVFDFADAVLSMQAAPDGGVYFSSAIAIYHLVEE